jgi:AraC-like DNA-binding protein
MSVFQATTTNTMPIKATTATTTTAPTNNQSETHSVISEHNINNADPYLSTPEQGIENAEQDIENMLRLTIDNELVNEDTPTAIRRLEQLEKSFSHLIKKARLALCKAHDLKQAKLPSYDGVAGKVVETIQRRIGNASLDIDNVAKELNMSKRTLQRRLHRHQIQFAQLREQVRYYHATRLLIDSPLSIDQISEYLGFSDRTSFTNAFKRWTNLAPSTFRKSARDYGDPNIFNNDEAFNPSNTSNVDEPEPEDNLSLQS